MLKVRELTVRELKVREYHFYSKELLFAITKQYKYYNETQHAAAASREHHEARAAERGSGAALRASSHDRPCHHVHRRRRTQPGRPRNHWNKSFTYHFRQKTFW